MATASLIKLIIAAREHCSKTIQKLEVLEQTKAAGIYEATNVRMVFDGIYSTLEHYKKDQKTYIDKKDKDAVERILRNIERIADSTAAAAGKLKAAVKRSGNTKAELDTHRSELSSAIQTVHSLQTSFLTFVYHFIPTSFPLSDFSPLDCRKD